jgi:hypothetical protein
MNDDEVIVEASETEDLHRRYVAASEEDDLKRRYEVMQKLNIELIEYSIKADSKVEDLKEKVNQIEKERYALHQKWLDTSVELEFYKKKVEQLSSPFYFKIGYFLVVAKLFLLYAACYFFFLQPALEQLGKLNETLSETRFKRHEYPMYSLVKFNE